MSLHITLLGGFSVCDGDGTPLRLPTRKCEALLACLAAQPGEPQRRERLAGLLWPEAPEAQARASLRQTLALLRKSLGPDGARILSAAREDVQLGKPIPTDLARFEAALEDGRPAALVESAEIYRGEFLEGFTIDSDAFEEWRRDTATRIRNRYADALEHGLDACIDAGDVARGLALGERLVQLDPCSEIAYRGLMRLHLAQGARAAAVRQYERCRQVLREELGLSVSPETELVYREVVSRTTRATRPRPRTSIAVLPFANLSNEPQQDYFAQGFAEDLLTELARFRSIYVTARNSSFAIANRGLTMQQIGEELGVQYLLEGSVRKTGDALRITGQLIDAVTGFHVWAERYDVPLDQLFSVQDRIVQSVARALASRIEACTLAESRKRPPETLEAYDHWLQGIACLHAGTLQEDERARMHFRRALEVDPHYPRAYTGMALSYFNEISCALWSRLEENMREAYAYATRGVELDDMDHVTHYILAKILVWRREYEAASRHIERALALNPNDADMLAHLAMALTYIGDSRAGIELAETAVRLNPHHPGWYAGFLAYPYFMESRHGEAIALLQRAPDVHTDSRALLAAAHALEGRGAEAEANARAFCALYRQRIVPHRKPQPGEAFEWALQVNPFRLSEDLHYLREGLVAAGLQAA